MISDGPRWSQMIQDDTRWSWQNDLRRSQTKLSLMVLDPHGPRWSKCYLGSYAWIILFSITGIARPTTFRFPPLHRIVLTRTRSTISYSPRWRTSVGTIHKGGRPPRIPPFGGNICCCFHMFCTVLHFVGYIFVFLGVGVMLLIDSCLTEYLFNNMRMLSIISGCFLL